MNARVTNLEQELKPAGLAAQSLTVSDSAVSLPAIAGTYLYLMFDVITANIRMTVDGTDPVASTTGHLLAANTHRIWHKDLLKTAKFIKDGETDATIFVTPLTI